VSDPVRDVLKTLEKEILLDLEAMVLTVAILSPITVIAVALAFSPEIPANNELII
jgi:hypothetical protein